MKRLQAFNHTRQTELAARVRVAHSLFQRAVGLLGTRSLPAGEALWLSPCTSVHMFFMRYAIDVLFLDAAGSVLKGQTLRPWRFSAWVRGSVGALELPAGTLQSTQTVAGDRVELRNV